MLLGSGLCVTIQHLPRPLQGILFPLSIVLLEVTRGQTATLHKSPGAKSDQQEESPWGMNRDWHDGKTLGSSVNLPMAPPKTHQATPAT